MRIIHWLAGSIILSLNWIFTPKSISRDVAAQRLIDESTAKLRLYHYKACPFCVKVQRTIKRESLNIETRDAKRSAQAKDELVSGGGKLKVPCLRIEDEQGQVSWMYESSDIIAYLKQRVLAA